MNDTELVYALYVQANPVPDPGLLPLTPAETELLTFERSPDMETQQTIEVRPTEPVPRRRALALGLGAIVVVIGVAAAAFLFAGDSDSPVAAADASPEVVFDGTSCAWNGPVLIERGQMEITAINTTNDPFTLSAWAVQEPALTAELERTPLGTDMATTPTTPAPAGLNTFLIPVLADSEVTTSVWMGGAGAQLIDCVTSSDGSVDHVWRANSLVEVVAP